MTAQADVSFADWFRCPHCGETTDEGLEAKLILAFRNSSLSLTCRNCGFDVENKDPRSPNWRTRLDWIFKTKSHYHTHPIVKREVLNAGQCPVCSSRTVSIEVESKTQSTGHREFDRETWTRFYAECYTCGFEYNHKLEHTTDDY